MARKKHKRKQPGQLKLAQPEWAKFCVGYLGKGAHRDKTVYRRQDKHVKNSGDHDDGRDEE